MSYRRITALTALLLILLLSGCGKKTALIPPQKLVPVIINDLRYILDESGVTLKWSYPTKMENGDELGVIETFQIYRAAVPESEFCQGCPVQFEEPVEIDGGRLPASGDIRTASYSEGYLQNGYHYLYKVRSRAGWWYPSSDSNIVSFVWSVPPRVPGGLQLVPGDRTVTLTWHPVLENLEGDLLGQKPVYQVYRKHGNEEFIPLGEPVREPGFTDSGLANERLYSYRVRAVLVNDETVQAGGASQVVSGVPRDLMPPPPPENLVAVAIPAGIKLVWQMVTGEDLAGYRIYRRAMDAAVPELAAEVGPAENQYIDQSMLTGKRWFYTVTSIDTAQQANESLPSAEAVIDLR